MASTLDRQREKNGKVLEEIHSGIYRMKFAISPEEKLCFQSKPCAVFMWHLFAIWFEIFKIDPIGGWTKVTFSFKVTLSVRCKREDFFSFHQSVS